MAITAAVVGATAAVVGTVSSINQQKKAAAAQRRQQQLQARRSQRQAVRQAQIQRAQQQAAAQGLGVVGGSAIAGGAASLSSQTGAALGYAGEMSGLSNRISIASQKADTAGAIAGLGGQMFSSAGGFGTLFPTAQGGGAPDAGALLKGIG